MSTVTEINAVESVVSAILARANEDGWEISLLPADDQGDVYTAYVGLKTPDGTPISVVVNVTP